MQNTRRCTDVMQMRIRMMKKKKNGGEKNPSVTKKQPLRFGLSAGKCVYLTRDFGFCESDCEQMEKDVTRRLNQSGVGWNLIHLSHP